MSGSVPCDFNFCYPIPPFLETERLKLVPFLPSVHSAALLRLSRAYPEVYRYCPWGPFDTHESMDHFLEYEYRQRPGYLLYAIIDTTKPSSGPECSEGAFAGALDYTNTSTQNLAIEIGAVMIFPPFQRTHVATNAVGLMLKHALDLPDQGGLGLRRVVWQADNLNKASIGLAERMGFRMEGIARWDRALPQGKIFLDKTVRAGDTRPECPGRDGAILAICWDDWEDGARDRVITAMARRQ